MAYPVPQADPTSVIGRRIIAALIDGLLVAIPVIALATSQFEYYDVADLPVSAEEYCDLRADQGDVCFNAEDLDDRVYFSEGNDSGPNGLWFALSLGLYVLLQGLTGWTPGKLIAGIRVVRDDGRKPGIVKALVRWLLWIVDGFPYFLPGLVGFVVGLTTTGHRRVGDMAAKTLVVKRAAAGAPIVVPGLTAPPAAAAPWGTPPPGAPGAPAGWGAPPDPNAAGWASPAAPPPTAAAPPVTTTPSADGPQWDAARGTYIQWDPTQGAWMQWDDGFKAWSRIPGQ